MKKRLRIYGLLVVILFPCLLFPQTGTRDQFEQRKLQILDDAAAAKETSIFAATARIAQGKDLAHAYAMFDSLTRDHVAGGMFYAYTMIGGYLYCRAQLPETLQTKIRNAFRVRTMYRGDTENHWVMYYTGMYLAAQTWPGEGRSEWFNGKNSTENFQEAAGWLNHWITLTTTIGQGEFDSPTYMTVFMAPMMVLYEFAQDSLMKRKAHMILDLLFADFGAEHLRGNYGGGHSRDYPEDIINPLAAPTTVWSWLYFGEPKSEVWDDARYTPRHPGSWETVFGALSSYRLPDVVLGIATDRSTPYVHKERKRVRNIIRFSDQMNPRVYKYTYMTPDYVLGSLQGGILQPIQQHTWDVTFASGQPNNTIFTLHPYASGHELAMFFPEEQKFLAGEVDRYHKVYTSPDKWNSSSPYEQTFQHENVLMVLYDIKRGALQQHIDGFFPKDLDDRMSDRTGWIFARKGDVYVAFFPLQPYEWIEEQIDWRWRSHMLKNGVVVEVGRKADVGSFEQFQESERRRIPRFALVHGSPSATFVTAAGDSMRFVFGGSRMLNGTVVKFSDEKLYDGPWMHSDLGSGVITLTYRGKMRILDFPACTLTEH